MFCTNCGAQLSEDAKFCESCGQPLEKANSEVNSEVAASTTASQSNEYVSKAKEVSSNYLGVFVKQLKSPFYEARQLNHSQMTNGMITIGLFALFISLTLYTLAKSTAGPYVQVSFGSTFFPSFIGIAITLLIVASVIFVTMKIMRIDSGFGVVVNRLGSLLSVATIISAAALLLAIMQAGFLSTMLLYFSSITVSIAIFAVIFSFDREDKGGLDPFYGLIIASIGTAIAFTIVFVVFLGSVLDGLA